MQYQNAKYFIFAVGKRFLGGMHKVAEKRQMFLCQNHALRFWEKLHKI